MNFAYTVFSPSFAGSITQLFVLLNCSKPPYPAPVLLNCIWVMLVPVMFKSSLTVSLSVKALPLFIVILPSIEGTVTLNTVEGRYSPLFQERSLEFILEIFQAPVSLRGLIAIVVEYWVQKAVE